MTINTKNPYEFIPKPSFPIVGKIYADSIDWQKDKVDAYSLSIRHTGISKSQTISDKSREPRADSTYNTKI